MAFQSKQGRYVSPKYRALAFLKWFFAFLGKAILTVMAVGIFTGCIVATALGVYVMKFVDPDDSVDLSRLPLNFTTILYVNDPESGEPTEWQRLYGLENRIWIDFDQMPDHLQQAFIAVEDERFPTHHGVDWKRTAAATVNYILPGVLGSGSFGGSTITQQLIKNITGDDEVRIERKVQEIFRALNLEKKYSKEQILEAYLNTIHLGNNTNGVQAAANLYFNKDAKDLTAAESAAIAAITKYPTYYNPFLHPDNNKERQEYVLRKMHDLGYLTDQEYQDSLKEELKFSEEQAKKQATFEVNNWFIDQVIEDVINDLVEQKGYQYSYAESQIYRGGYRIYTTMDVDIQNYLEQVYLDEGEIFPTQKGEVQPQSAMIIMDYSGNIVGIVGGRGEKTQNRVLNRATMSKRQPGSTMKPMGVYGPAIEYNLINWSTILPDEPLDMTEGGRTYKWPVNYYGFYRGNMTVDEALQRSTNTVAVRVGMMVGPTNSFEFLVSKLGITSVVREKEINGQMFSDAAIAPMSLGAVTEGITLREMAGAYQVYGNGGLYNKPRTYTKVLDSEGNVVLENKSTPLRAVSEETACVMNKLLQRVVKGPYGSGAQSRFGNWELAGKTGTTSDNKDHWYVGLTPHYVGVVWWGYDIPEELIYYNIHPPMRAWRTVMSGIHESLPEKAFPVSGNVVQKTYCTQSGLLASPFCTSTGTGWYKQGGLPSYCSEHYEPVTSTETGPEEEEPEEDNSSGGDDGGEDEAPSSSGGLHLRPAWD